MSPTINPLEIARETLRLLAARRIPPTPDNYRILYNEICGAPDLPPPFPEKHLHSLVSGLPKDAPEQLRLIRELEQAIKYEDWDSFKNHLLVYLQALLDSQRLAWAELIGDLIRQWELRQINLTTARKRETLTHVLSSTANNPDLLFSRLQGVIRVWAQAATDDSKVETAAAETATALALGQNAATVPAKGNKGEGAEASASDVEQLFHRNALEMLQELQAMLVVALESSVALLTDESGAQLADDARRLADEVRIAETLEELQGIFNRIKRFSFQLNVYAGDQVEYRNSLVTLLRLLVDNVGELVVDDFWLHGQIEAIRNIIDKPLSQRAIDDAERCLREVIAKQGKIKTSLVEAKDALKTMLTTFVDQLSNLADSTSDYHDKIEVCAQKISAAEDISELQVVITDLMHETRSIQENARRSQEELESTRMKVIETEQRISQLQHELEEASTLVRHDQLTGVLNRRGLEEVFVKECARARRHQSPLCVTLLDIDNFKKLNDSLGHDAGDEALIHLSKVIRENLRPQDSIGRYGGEEFVILLPETELENGIMVITRLQRELTRRIFLHDHEKTLITFSAGITLWQDGEAQNVTLKRADEAMYVAKKTGKNRVVPV